KDEPGFWFGLVVVVGLLTAINDPNAETMFAKAFSSLVRGVGTGSGCGEGGSNIGIGTLPKWGSKSNPFIFRSASRKAAQSSFCLQLMRRSPVELIPRSTGSPRATRTSTQV